MIPKETTFAREDFFKRAPLNRLHLEQTFPNWIGDLVPSAHQSTGLNYSSGITLKIQIQVEFGTRRDVVCRIARAVLLWIVNGDVQVCAVFRGVAPSLNGLSHELLVTVIVNLELE